jgi:hypothetical protein
MMTLSGADLAAACGGFVEPIFRMVESWNQPKTCPEAQQKLASLQGPRESSGTLPLEGLLNDRLFAVAKERAEGDVEGLCGQR